MGVKNKLTEPWMALSTDRLVKADWNYKTENEFLTKQLTENIKRNGQIENIIVRELETGFYEVVNGNHRYDVLVALGIDTVVVYNLGAISLAHAQRIAIETNETGFERDEVRLAMLIKEIQEAFTLDDLSLTMPFTSEELSRLDKLADFDFNDFNKDAPPPSDDGDDAASFKTVLLHVPEEVYEVWQAWVMRCRAECANPELSETRCFELAIVEAANTPRG